MKLKTIQKKADSLGLNTRINLLTDGREGLFISLETVIDGRARMIDRATEGTLFKYLKRYKVAYEYRGHYTSILIIGKNEEKNNYGKL